MDKNAVRRFAGRQNSMFVIVIDEDRFEFAEGYVLKSIRTIKWLKISIILQVIFALFCISSLVCILVYKYSHTDIFLSLCILSMYGWIINPTGLITIIIGLTFFFIDKKDKESRITIGKKWIWFILFFVFDTLLYLVSIGEFVAITGGV